MQQRSTLTSRKKYLRNSTQMSGVRKNQRGAKVHSVLGYASVFKTLPSSLEGMQICRVCLTKNVPMYHIWEHDLSAMYERVTGVNIDVKDQLPQVLCSPCVDMLKSASGFIEKAITTYRFLMDTSIKINITKNAVRWKSTAKNKRETKNDWPKIMTVDESDVQIIEETVDNNHINKSNDEIGVEVAAPHEQVTIPTDNEKMNLDVETPNNANDENIEIDVTENAEIKNEPLDFKEEQVDAVTEPASDVVYKEVDLKCEGNEDSNIKIEDINSLNNAVSLRDKLTFEDDMEAPESKIENNDLPSKNKVKTYSRGGFICQICNMSYRDKSNLEQHIKKHAFNLNCSHCDYKTNNDIDLKRHTDAKHTKSMTYTDPCYFNDLYKNKSLFRCSQCDYVAPYSKSVINHTIAKHFNSSMYKCDSCNYITDRIEDLTDHSNAKHNKTEKNNGGVV